MLRSICVALRMKVVMGMKCFAVEDLKLISFHQ